VEDAGTYETQGERNRVSVVARAISSVEFASGVSGAVEKNPGTDVPGPFAAAGGVGSAIPDGVGPAAANGAATMAPHPKHSTVTHSASP
jgi:hypothetical protein